MNVNPIDENQILREVWDTINVGAKTELQDNQIQAVNKLKSLATIFGNAFLDNHLDYFMTLQKSRNRKSMDEFVNIVKGQQPPPPIMPTMGQRMFG